MVTSRDTRQALVHLTSRPSSYSFSKSLPFSNRMALERSCIPLPRVNQDLLGNHFQLSPIFAFSQLEQLIDVCVLRMGDMLQSDLFETLDHFLDLIVVLQQEVLFHLEVAMDLPHYQLRICVASQPTCSQIFSQGQPDCQGLVLYLVIGCLKLENQRVFYHQTV